MVKANWKKIEQGGGGSSYFPEGRHSVLISDVKEMPWKSDSLWEITYTGMGGEVEGKTHVERIYLSEKALWKVKWLATKAGIDMDSTEGEWNLNSYTLVGKRLGIEIKSESYVNQAGIEKSSHKVVGYYSLSEVVPGQLPTDEANIPF